MHARFQPKGGIAPSVDLTCCSWRESGGNSNDAGHAACRGGSMGGEDPLMLGKCDIAVFLF